MNVILIALGTGLLIAGIVLIRQQNKSALLKLAAWGFCLAGIASFVPVYGTIGGIFTATGTFFLLGLIIAVTLGKSKAG